MTTNQLVEIQDDEKNVKLRCPICKKLGYIKIVGNSQVKSNGLITVNVSKDLICEHTFIAYIDGNLVARDCVVADFCVDSNDISPNQEIKKVEEEQENLIDASIIKYNIPLPTLAYILKAVFYKKKIALVLEETYLYDKILNFFTFITQDNFKIDISIMSKDDYTPYINLIDDYIVLDRISIIRDKNKILNSKNLLKEKKIIAKFIDERDSIMSAIILKNELNKIYSYVTKIVEIISYKSQEQQK